MDDSATDIELAPLPEAGAGSKEENVVEQPQLELPTQGETTGSTLVQKDNQQPQPVENKRSASCSVASLSNPQTVEEARTRFNSLPSASAKKKEEDKIVFVEHVEIEMSTPDKQLLTSMDFPKADDGHEEDVAKVIRKSFSKIGVGHNTPDALAAISKSFLGHVTFMSDVEAAVDKHEQADQIWQKVCQRACIYSAREPMRYVFFYVASY